MRPLQTLRLRRTNCWSASPRVGTISSTGIRPSCDGPLNTNGAHSSGSNMGRKARRAGRSDVSRAPFLAKLRRGRLKELVLQLVTFAPVVSVIHLSIRITIVLEISRERAASVNEPKHARKSTWKFVPHPQAIGTDCPESK